MNPVLNLFIYFSQYKTIILNLTLKTKSHLALSLSYHYPNHIHSLYLNHTFLGSSAGTFSKINDRPIYFRPGFISLLYSSKAFRILFIKSNLLSLLINLKILLEISYINAIEIHSFNAIKHLMG